MLDIARPFVFFTQSIGKSSSPTLPYVLETYDSLFERLNESHRRLTSLTQRESTVAVTSLLSGIKAAQAKLDFYYNKVYGNLGSLYGIGAILNPERKLDVFDPEFCWLDPTEKDWKVEFEEQFRVLYTRDYGKQSYNTVHLQQLRDDTRDLLAIVLSFSRMTDSTISSSPSRSA